MVLCLFNCGAAYSGLTERNGLRIGFNGCQFFVIFTECIVGLVSLYRSGCLDSKLKTPSNGSQLKNRDISSAIFTLSLSIRILNS